jgi:F-type H+-transporting ATPase subunit b
VDGRIFGLDIQLGFDVILQAVAVFIMFMLLSYILFEPVRKMLNDRKNRIAGELDQAAADQKDAAELKAEYDQKLKNVEKEADEILAQARKKALKREEEIVAQAKEEASRLMESANHEIELQKAKVQDQMKQEMVQVAVMMAGKMIASQITAEEQNALVDETLQEMGDKTWLQE